LALCGPATLKAVRSISFAEIRRHPVVDTKFEKGSERIGTFFETKLFSTGVSPNSGTFVKTKLFEKIGDVRLQIISGTFITSHFWIQKLGISQ
jgi:hypothetical protein